MEFYQMLAGFAVDYSLFIINYSIIEEVLQSKVVERCWGC